MIHRRENTFIQTKSFTLEEYSAAGCWQLEGQGRAVGVALFHHTRGMMCGGCPQLEGRGCGAHKKLHLVVAKEKANPVETVKAESKRLNISISEVRRRRAAVDQR